MIRVFAGMNFANVNLTGLDPTAVIDASIACEAAVMPHLEPE